MLETFPSKQNVSNILIVFQSVSVLEDSLNLNKMKITKMNFILKKQVQLLL